MASGGRRVVGGKKDGRFWAGSRPNAVRTKHAVSTSIPPADGPGWVYTPAGSHISRFRFTDARESSLQKSFGFGTSTEGGVRRGEGASELLVVFRDQATKAETAAYLYFFADHAEGAAVAERMRLSPHPHGQVLYPEVIAPDVIPYRPY